MDDSVLVGLDVSDDAAVVKLSDDRAIVVTLDFFTPIVDDPYAYGGIAAANSLSDCYAMGAEPLVALNIAALSEKIPLEVSAEILRGGAEKAREAGIIVAGGHTVKDQEPKYGLVVIGMIDPAELTRKGGARPGDKLLLSKPLGTGVVTTALMQDKATDAEVESATNSMMRLNREAATVAHEAGATAVTDITGFGFLGHAAEMAERGEVGFSFRYGRMPWLDGVERLAPQGVFPGGASTNQDHFDPVVEFDADLAVWQRRLLFSPETSGGLLMAVPEHRVADALAAAADRTLDLAEVGEVEAEPGLRVRM